MKSIVKILPGFFFGRNKKPIHTLRDAMAEEAKCGCGIDCCNNELILTDKTSDTKVKLYFDSGGLVVETSDGTKYDATLTAQ